MARYMVGGSENASSASAGADGLGCDHRYVPHGDFVTRGSCCKRFDFEIM